MFTHTTTTTYLWDAYVQEAIGPMLQANPNLDVDRLASRVARFADEMCKQRERRFDLKEDKK